MVEFGRIYINIKKKIKISIFTESFRFFRITRGCVPLTLIKPQERPTSSLSSDWSTWKGQGALAVEPMIHQLSMGWTGLGQHRGHSFEAIVSYHFLITDTDVSLTCLMYTLYSQVITCPR